MALTTRMMMNAYTLAILAVFAAASSVDAQDQPPQPIRRQLVSSNSAPDNQIKGLSRNYAVTIAGSLGKSDPVDVILRGSSSKFSAELENPMRKIEIVLNEDGDNVTVLYSIFARIAVKAGENAISYQDASVAGSFRAPLGEEFAVLEVGGSRLTIKVDPMSGKK